MDEKTIEETLFSLANLAAKQTLPHFRARTEIENKLQDGFDPVTLADKNAEAAIRAYIIERFPSHGFLGEEHGAHNMDAEYCWVVDPIDGTRAFISGLPGWGTLISLCKNKVPIAGMMAQPYTGELFYSTSNKSFFKRENEKIELKTSYTDELSAAILMTTDPFIINEKLKPAFDELKDQCKLTRYGYDCYAYAMLAAGHIELVVETDLNAYDISALIPLIENAGGCVTNWNGNSAKDGGNIIAAANKTLLDKAIKTLNN